MVFLDQNVGGVDWKNNFLFLTRNFGLVAQTRWHKFFDWNMESMMFSVSIHVIRIDTKRSYFCLNRIVNVLAVILENQS